MGGVMVALVMAPAPGTPRGHRQGQVPRWQSPGPLAGYKDTEEGLIHLPRQGAQSLEEINMCTRKQNKKRYMICPVEAYIKSWRRAISFCGNVRRGHRQGKGEPLNWLRRGSKMKTWRKRPWDGGIDLWLGRHSCVPGKSEFL